MMPKQISSPKRKPRTVENDQVDKGGPDISVSYASAITISLRLVHLVFVFVSDICFCVVFLVKLHATLAACVIFNRTGLDELFKLSALRLSVVLSSFHSLMRNKSKNNFIYYTANALKILIIYTLHGPYKIIKFNILG